MTVITGMDGVRVLVVDDSSDHRELMARALRDVGVETTTASSADEAFRHVEDVDLVLLDYRMPGVDGLEALQTIGAVPNAPSVVMVTGLDSVDVAVEALRTGAVDYLQKSDDLLDELPSVVERAWRHHLAIRRGRRLQECSLLVSGARDRADAVDGILAGALDLLDASGAEIHLVVGDATGPGDASTKVVGRRGDLAETDAVARDLLQSAIRSGTVQVGEGRIVAPLTGLGGVVGVVTVSDRPDRAWLEEDERLVEAFAAFAGVSLENLRHRELETQLVHELQATLDQRRNFVASISHELRTPLTMIIGFVETLRSRWERMEDGTRLEFLERVAANSGELANLVDQLLDVSAGEAGTLAVHTETVPVADVVNEAILGLAHLFEGRDVEVDVGEVSVVADRRLLVRGLSNLLSNAVKYSPAPEPVSVRGVGLGDWVRIDVTDRGDGLDEEARARVFEPFWRSERERRNATRGTGVGLALVREYLRVMGGTVGVVSAPGEGSTFTLELPSAGTVAPTDERVHLDLTGSQRNTASR